MEPNEVITNFAMLEYPFVREGITHEEYAEEMEYFMHHYEDYRNGTYRPLWAQRDEHAI